MTTFWGVELQLRLFSFVSSYKYLWVKKSEPVPGTRGSVVQKHSSVARREEGLEKREEEPENEREAWWRMRVRKRSFCFPGNIFSLLSFLLRFCCCKLANGSTYKWLLFTALYDNYNLPPNPDPPVLPFHFPLQYTYTREWSERQSEWKWDEMSVLKSHLQALKMKMSTMLHDYSLFVGLFSLLQTSCVYVWVWGFTGKIRVCLFSCLILRSSVLPRLVWHKQFSHLFLANSVWKDLQPRHDGSLEVTKEEEREWGISGGKRKRSPFALSD